MDFQFAKARCLIRKLPFLRRITDCSPVNADTLSLRTLFALSDDIGSVCLVRECLELEDHFETNSPTGTKNKLPCSYMQILSFVIDE